jgi:hypothetical protein
LNPTWDLKMFRFVSGHRFSDAVTAEPFAPQSLLKSSTGDSVLKGRGFSRDVGTVNISGGFSRWVGRLPNSSAMP